MKDKFISVSGILKSGHRVASGRAKNSPYERGTIEMQMPYFRDLGLDLSGFYWGTLNISIAPYSFELVKPQYTFPLVKWHPNYDAETFSFSPCEIVYRKINYQSLIYYPHPETKLGHFQDDSIIEAIAPEIPGIKYGDRLILKVATNEIKIII